MIQACTFGFFEHIFSNFYMEQLSMEGREPTTVYQQEPHGLMPGNWETKLESINHALLSMRLCLDTVLKWQHHSLHHSNCSYSHSRHLLLQLVFLLCNNHVNCNIMKSYSIINGQWTQTGNSPATCLVWDYYSLESHIPMLNSVHTFQNNLRIFFVQKHFGARFRSSND